MASLTITTVSVSSAGDPSDDDPPGDNSGDSVPTTTSSDEGRTPEEIIARLRAENRLLKAENRRLRGSKGFVPFQGNGRQAKMRRSRQFTPLKKQRADERRAIARGGTGTTTARSSPLATAIPVNPPPGHRNVFRNGRWISVEISSDELRDLQNEQRLVAQHSRSQELRTTRIRRGVPHEGGRGGRSDPEEIVPDGTGGGFDAAD